MTNIRAASVIPDVVPGRAAVLGAGRAGVPAAERGGAAAGQPLVRRRRAEAQAAAQRQDHHNPGQREQRPVSP